MSFLFGSSSSETTIPEWLEQPAREMLQRSIDQSKVGHMPYAGPQVAGLDPQQVAAMQNTSSAASAFGLNSAAPRVPEATDYGNGLWGVSSMPLYQQQMQYMQNERPGQLQYYNDFFVDPVSGQAGARMIDTPTIEGVLQQVVRDYGGAGDQGYGGPGESGDAGLGGYSGLGDMFDGGGPGASGDEYGGRFGGVSNALGGLFG